MELCRYLADYSVANQRSFGAPSFEGDTVRFNVNRAGMAPKGLNMRILSGVRGALIALMALAGASYFSPAQADSGTIRFTIYKAGFVFGGSGGSGVLHFRGRNYPISIGGISYGFTFGASETRFRGRVTNIRRPSDVAGVYGQAGAGAAVVKGVQAVVLTNQSGAVLTLTGEQTGVIVSADLSGLALTLK